MGRWQLNAVVRKVCPSEVADAGEISEVLHAWKRNLPIYWFQIPLITRNIPVIKKKKKKGEKKENSNTYKCASPFHFL